MEVDLWFEDRTRPVPALRASHFQEGPAVNIRISGKDLEALQKRALEEGIPYQTLIASLLHEYVSGRLVERAA